MDIMGICRCKDKNTQGVAIGRCNMIALIALKLKYILWLIAKLSHNIAKKFIILM